MTDLLFVYGTLRSEFDNPYAVYLRTEGEFAGQATVAGSIFHVAHYPGYRSQPAGEVRGEVYRLPKPEQALAVLDEWEGTEYERVPVTLLENGLEAWIYRYATALPADRRITSGDFTRP